MAPWWQLALASVAAICAVPAVLQLLPGDARVARPRVPATAALHSSTATAVRVTDGPADCSELVRGAQGAGAAGCTCPEGRLLAGEEPACLEFLGRASFPLLEIQPGVCYCQRQYLDEADVRRAEEYLDGTFTSNFLGIFRAVGCAVLDWRKVIGLWSEVKRLVGFTGYMAQAYFQMTGSSFAFPNMNFVRGFQPEGGIAGAVACMKKLWKSSEPKWLAPVRGERLGVMTFAEYGAKVFKLNFNGTVLEKYYTGGRVPSWEDNENHRAGVALLDTGMKAARMAGQDPILLLRKMEPRFAFDHEALTRVTWKGFSWMGPYDIKYASNGAHGAHLVDSLLARHNTKDALGVLMTDSVFSAHLRYKASDRSFNLDLTSMERYKPIPGYASLGGGATFSLENGRLKTRELRFKGKTYVPSEDDDEEANKAFRENRLTGWRYAEKAVIASLLGMTNLVLHVKDLHLELAAAFQATTVDAFAANPEHPVRRLLDPFVHRSVQATNDNLKLLFEYKAAEFSLAPLPHDEQLRLIDDAVNENPMILANLDMERYGQLHGMDPAFSTEAAQHDSGLWFWRWHYRALKVQRLFDDMIGCWLERNYGDSELADDELAQAWWESMIKHLPSLRRATEQHPSWASGGKLTRSSLRNVLKTMFVWLAWVHEDVGHSAAAYVYNPIHTPMCVPEDGEGVPMQSFAFNVAAYRGFVFLERAKLLDSPPAFWFGEGGDRQCFADFQEALRHLGASDMAFSECDEHGFYSCVERVETAVSS